MSTRRADICEGWHLEFPDPSQLPAGVPVEVPATVPGCVHTDLIAIGVIDDITREGREADQAWIARTSSRYSTRIAIPDDGSERHTLVFYGLDTLATVSINGVPRLTTQNMHRTYRLDITDESRDGSVDITVDFAAPLPAAEARMAELGDYPNPYEMPYNMQRKMACSYGWDWGPITISSGIWRPVHLESWATATFASVAVVAWADEADVPHVRVRTDVEGLDSETTVRVRVMDSEGLTIAYTDMPADSDDVTIAVPEAALWFPRGWGRQPRYDVVVDLHHGDVVLDSVVKRVGFRRVELDTQPISDPNGEHMFALKVNGRRIWMTGANWIPDDPFPHRVDRVRYEARIADAIDVGIRALRIWGGGIYESDDLYEIADREGILVWQDFLFACAAYPETEEMIREVRAEAQDAVSRLSHHPSLVLWCGGNECIEGYQYWGWQDRLEGKPWGETFYRQVLPEVVAQLDATRPYIAGSPISTISDDVRDFRAGTSHIWDVWNQVSYTRYEEYRPAFAAEFGFNGPGGWLSLTHAINRDSLDSRDPDLVIHQKAFNGMENIARQLGEEFTRPLTDGPAWYVATQLQQARAVSVGLRHFRSLYERCSGTLLWQFNDMWPALSWAVLDVSGHRKLAWYAMQQAYKPRLLVWGRVDHGAMLTIVNDTDIPWDEPLKVSVFTDSGDLVAEAIRDLHVPARCASHLSSRDLLGSVHEGIAVATMGQTRASRRLTMAPASTAPASELRSETVTTAHGVDVTVTSQGLTHELSLLPELAGVSARVDSQLVTLLPGEAHTFRVHCEPHHVERIIQRVSDVLWSHNRLTLGS